MALPPNRCKPWTRADDRLLLSLYHEAAGVLGRRFSWTSYRPGAPGWAIADKLGRTLGAVHTRIAILRVARRAKPWPLTR